MKAQLFVCFASACVLLALAASACAPAATPHPLTQSPAPEQVVAQVATKTPELVSTPELPDTPEPIYTQTPTARAPVIHIVRSGDTLSKIAQQYGVTVESIVRTNSIQDPNLIEVGRRLVIPKSEELSELVPLVTAASVAQITPPVEDKLRAALSLWGMPFDLQISRLTVEDGTAVIEGTTGNDEFDSYDDQYFLDSEVKALALEGVFSSLRAVDKLHIVTVRIVHKGKIYLETTATRTAAENAAISIAGVALTELVHLYPDGTATSTDLRYLNFLLDDADRILSMFSTSNYIPRLGKAPSVPTAAKPSSPGQIKMRVSGAYTHVGRVGSRGTMRFTIDNTGSTFIPSIKLQISKRFFEGWLLVSAEPPLIEDHSSLGDRYLTFLGMSPGGSITYTLNLVAAKAGEYNFSVLIYVGELNHVGSFDGRTVVVP